jgi:hypothetical protein
LFVFCLSLNERLELFPTSNFSEAIVVSAERHRLQGGLLQLCLTHLRQHLLGIQRNRFLKLEEGFLFVLKKKSLAFIFFVYNQNIFCLDY